MPGNGKTIIESFKTLVADDSLKKRMEYRSMEKLYSEIINIRKRVTAVAEIARWLWCINAVVVVVAIIYLQYELAALAGFTCVLSIVAAAIARRAALYVDKVDHTVHNSFTNQTQDVPPPNTIMGLENQ